MVCVIPFPPAAKKKHRRWRCHNTPCVVPTLVLPTSGTDGRRRFPATLSAWLPKLPRRHSRVCMSRTHMTRKSKGEIVLLSAAGMSRKSLALQGHSVFEFNPDESQRLSWLGCQPAACRRDVRMARPPQQPNRGVAERRHDLGDTATAHL